MKIYFSFGEQSQLSGYTTINLLHSSPNLDEVVEDAECESIIAEDIIGYIDANDVAPILDNWIKKLRKSGQIVIGGVDVGEVSRQFFNRNITLLDFNNLIYGTDRYRHSAMTAYELANALRGLGLKILKQRINPSNFHYIVVAERPS